MVLGGRFSQMQGLVWGKCLFKFIFFLGGAKSMRNWGRGAWDKRGWELQKFRKVKNMAVET